MVNKARKTEQRRNRYSREFKLDAIHLVKESGLSAREVSINLGLPPQLSAPANLNRQTKNCMNSNEN